MACLSDVKIIMIRRANRIEQRLAHTHNILMMTLERMIVVKIHIIYTEIDDDNSLPPSQNPSRKNIAFMGALRSQSTCF